jgi:hypothetical protein
LLLASLYFGSTSHDLAIVATNMRLGFAAAVLILLALNFSGFRRSSRGDLARSPSSLGGWIILALATIIFCQSDLLVRGARFPDQPEPPHSRSMTGRLSLCLLFHGCLGCSSCRFLRDLRNSSVGFDRNSATFYSALPPSWFLRLRLSDITVLRSTLSVVLVCATASLPIHTDHRLRDFHAKDHGCRAFSAARAILWSSHYLLARPLRSGLVVGSPGNTSLFYSTDHTFAHIAAALVCTFAMAPARGFSQSLADRLFVGGRESIFVPLLARLPSSWNR